MTKQDIARELSDRMDLKMGDSIQIVDTVIGIISDSLARERNIYLRGFATLSVVHTRPKKARNISEGTTVIVPARRKVKIKLSPTLSQRINGNDHY